MRSQLTAANTKMTALMDDPTGILNQPSQKRSNHQLGILSEQREERNLSKELENILKQMEIIELKNKVTQLNSTPGFRGDFCFVLKKMLHVRCTARSLHRIKTQWTLE